MAAKEEILMKLESRRGTYISGQKLADELKISRNAVWKAVNSLKQEGYQILSGGGGYCLAKDCDRFVPKRLERLLSPDPEGFGLYIYDSLDSTSNECKRRLMNGERNFAVLAEMQTAGRARNGGTFASPPEKGLYMSIALHKPMPYSLSGTFQDFTTGCVAEEIKHLTGFDCQKGRSGDILYNGQKICGILSEAVSDLETGMISDFVVGIGIYLHPTEERQDAEALLGCLNCRPVKNDLAAAVIKKLAAFDPSETGTANSYRFFSNRDCKYYPCHEQIKDLNCLFCYCPLYWLEKCPGTPTWLEKSGTVIKVCTDCIFPHKPENYEIVMKLLSAAIRKR